MLMSPSISLKQRLRRLISSWYSCCSVTTPNQTKEGLSSKMNAHVFIHGPNVWLFVHEETEERNLFFLPLSVHWLWMTRSQGHWILRTTPNSARGVKQCAPCSSLTSTSSLWETLRDFAQIFPLDLNSIVSACQRWQFWIFWFFCWYFNDYSLGSTSSVCVLCGKWWQPTLTISRRT